MSCYGVSRALSGMDILKVQRSRQRLWGGRGFYTWELRLRQMREGTLVKRSFTIGMRSDDMAGDAKRRVAIP